MSEEKKQIILPDELFSAQALYDTSIPIWRCPYCKQSTYRIVNNANVHVCHDEAELNMHQTKVEPNKLLHLYVDAIKSNYKRMRKLRAEHAKKHKENKNYKMPKHVEEESGKIGQDVFDAAIALASVLTDLEADGYNYIMTLSKKETVNND